MMDYSIGSQEAKQDAEEAIADIPQNKALLVLQMTDNPPDAPEVIGGLKTMNDVFAHFKPEREVTFENEDGGTMQETLQFRTLADFGKNGIIKQSAYLNELNHKVDDLQKFIRALRNNKPLQKVLENKELRETYLASIQAMIQEIEQTL